MEFMKVEVSNPKDAKKMLSVLNSKGINNSDISITAPNKEDFKKLNQALSFDNKQEVMMYSWLFGIVGAAIFTLITFSILGFISMDSNVGLNSKLVAALVIMGLFIGGLVGFMFGHATSSRKNLFKSKKLTQESNFNDLTLKFPLNPCFGGQSTQISS